MRHRSPPGEGRIVVVGAGPHALTFCSYLLTARPDWHHRLVVIDPDGWLARWDTMMRRLEIDVLRSPSVHHPDPAPYALLAFAEGRAEELIGDYKSPTVGLFSQFCRQLIARHRLEPVLRLGKVTAVAPVVPGCNEVRLADGTVLDAAVVVIAANRATPRIPAWVGALPDGVVDHAAHIEVDKARAGERIVVLGGGLTAAQLCLGASRRQASVTLVARAALRCSNTDVDPGWLGRYRLGPYLDEPDWEKRAALYTDARQGTMPGRWAAELCAAAANERISVRENVAVTDARSIQDQIRLQTTAGEIAADRLWLATGWDADTRQDSLLRPLSRAGTTTTGLPILDEHCRLADTTIHLTGAAAALQIGAVAPNLAGARVAAERIVGSLTPLGDPQYPLPPQIPATVATTGGAR